MTTNSQLSTLNLKNKNKNKLGKQLEQDQKWRSLGGLSARVDQGRMGEKVQVIRSINGQNNRQGEVKNSISNTTI